MKSSRDIPPRVGMQFYADFDYDDPRRRIIALRDGMIITDVDGDYPGRTASLYVWNDGHYEIQWTPPTDDERRLFMEAARGFGDRTHSCNEFCAWLLKFEPCSDDREIAESLALDGADYDAMPDFEELER